MSFGDVALVTRMTKMDRQNGAARRTMERSRKRTKNIREQVPQNAGLPQVALLIETSTEYGRGLLRGISRYARLYGPWSLQLAPGHVRDLLAEAAEWRGSGIIARISLSEARRLLRSVQAPCVVSSLNEEVAFPSSARIGEIRTDAEAIARMAALHLVEAGFRSLAYCGFENCNWSAEREKFMAAFAAERGLSWSVCRTASAGWMHPHNWIERWQKDKPDMIRWLKALPKPAGVVACNDVCGREVLEACAAAGLHVPEEVAVVGVDNDEMMCELATPPLSSVALDVERAGYEAARLLDSLMKGSPAKPRVVWVRPTRVAARLSSDVVAQEDLLVARALQVIRAQAAHNLGVSDIAKEVGVSRRTLERRFSAAAHRTVLDEIMRRRLERAKQLLLETDLRCYRVAAQSGFASLKTFNRVFRRSEGMTPQTFRSRSMAEAIGD